MPPNDTPPGEIMAEVYAVIDVTIDRSFRFFELAIVKDGLLHEIDRKTGNIISIHPRAIIRQFYKAKLKNGSFISNEPSFLP